VLLSRLTGESRPHCRLDRSAIQRLKDYHYPGNVRELRNVLQRALVHCRGTVINAADLHFQFELPTAVRPERADPPSLANMEREHIRDLLEHHHGHRRRVAERLGISERTLYRKLLRHGLGNC